jgi:hypothetical protein
MQPEITTVSAPSRSSSISAIAFRLSASSLSFE